MTDASLERLYARARIADYWIVNLLKQVVEVHRDPVPVTDAPYGQPYRSSQDLGTPMTGED